MKTKMYVSMNPKATLVELQAACGKASAEGYDLICVPQWFVAAAAEALRETNVKVTTIVGLPGGTTTEFAKFAEAKQAIVNGAKEFIVPLNMDLCKKGDLAAAKNDLAAALVASKKGADTAALIDAAELTDAQLKAVVATCATTSVGRILVAHAADDAIKAAAGDLANVEAY